MPRIPDSEFNTVPSQRVQEGGQVSTDTGTMKAIGQFGAQMERLGGILLEKSATADFLDWQQKYTNDMIDREVKFNEMLAVAKPEDYAEGGTLDQFIEETGNIREDYKSRAGGLWKSEDAKRFLDNRGTYYDDKFKIQKATALRKNQTASLGNLIQLNIKGIQQKMEMMEPVGSDVKEILNKLKSNETSSVLGSERTTELYGRVKEMLSESLVSSIEKRGDTKASRELASILGAELDEDQKKYLKFATDKARNTYQVESAKKQETALKTLSELASNPNTAEIAIGSSPTVIGEYLRAPTRYEAGQTNQSKKFNAIKASTDIIFTNLINKPGVLGEFTTSKELNAIVDREVNSYMERVGDVPDKESITNAVKTDLMTKYSNAVKEVQNGKGNLLAQYDKGIYESAQKGDVKGVVNRLTSLYDGYKTPYQDRNYAPEALSKLIGKEYGNWLGQPTNFYSAVNDALIEPSGDLYDRVVNDLYTAGKVDPAVILFNKVPPEQAQRVGKLLADYKNKGLTTKEVLVELGGISVAKFRSTVAGAIDSSDINLPMGNVLGSYNQAYKQGIIQIVEAMALEKAQQKMGGVNDVAKLAVDEFESMFTTAPVHGGKDSVLISNTSLQNNGIEKTEFYQALNQPQGLVEYVASQKNATISFDTISAMFGNDQSVIGQRAMQIAKEAKSNPELATQNFFKEFSGYLVPKNSSIVKDGIDIHMRVSGKDIPLRMTAVDDSGNATLNQFTLELSDIKESKNFLKRKGLQKEISSFMEMMDRTSGVQRKLYEQRLIEMQQELEELK